MAEYLIQDSTLTNLADKIRILSGTEGTMTPAVMNSNLVAANTELDNQDVLIEQLKAALEGKTAGGGSVGVDDISISIINRTITELRYDSLESIGDCAFYGCESLTTVDLPSATNIGEYAFDGCISLTTVDLPSATSIGAYAFYGCDKLEAVILRKSDAIVSLLNVYAFRSTGVADGTGYIYVPRALLSDTDESKDYRRATNWSEYAAQFRAIEDYPDVTGG